MRNGTLSVLLAVAWIGCALAAPAREKTLTGNWGGPHISLEATAEGARIEYDCAEGTIDGPIVLDRAGRFETTGTHRAEHGGPVREGEEPSSQPARYQGKVAGKTLKLTVTLDASGEEVGTFTLARGATPRLFKCL
ncbi:MAG TPA: hypothetical protein VHC97_18640 [Thermoanaerobaculia bacterium]|jgi:hypothetical protein|nr:hypothetical protein [Thermoanaerobaculia bacterium]